ncbi:hypothetical protein TVAG_283640 [Trichomonas vaginalis G3]|uniref:Uncharacterized protein n=1 Tax=Trichomonas vaginalis (strain ATCC PRA-98 / G3) TaxID=412133 RepID=A2DER8_TRIV3|nr:hypothetical protein TVAGG3_0576920 [Trichomonas vaginalis G3]EAY21195.1 hypothetical protein TVAG_283640 [Trichomonas vaginalis G3]KAI5522275.1 hypothetical protein TVAGG3_0576920 [Trichomonas vaginalis G3]|eukprot:XP_001582181.1 hypothetical protein [Trichomonas vaginalis G3]
MLLLFFFLASSKLKNYNIPSTFRFGQNMLDGTRKTFWWKAGPYTGTNEWPFNPGYYHNYQWLDNYKLGFLANGFTFFVIAAVVFLVCCIFGFISYFCFNDKRDGKSKLICIFALIFMFTTTILVIACLILVIVNNADKVSMDQSVTNSPMDKIFSQLRTISLLFSSAVKDIGNQNNTRQIYRWMNNYITDLTTADDEAKTFLNAGNYVFDKADKAKEDYLNQLKSLAAACNNYINDYNANNGLSKKGSDLVKDIYGYERIEPKTIKNVFDDRNGKDQEFLVNVCNNKEKLTLLQESFFDYIKMHQNLRPYVKSLTDSILVLNKRGVPAMEAWITDEFNPFVETFQVTDSTAGDSFGNHLKSYNSNNQTYVIVSIVGAVLAIGGLVMIIVFVLAPKMNIAIAAFICGIGFMILCFGIGASFGTTNFYISSDDHLNNSFSDKNASDKNQFAYYNIFVCPYDSIIESFNYLETQTEGSFSGFISSYIHYSNYTDQIGQLITKMGDNGLIKNNQTKIPFYTGDTQDKRYNSSNIPRSPAQAKLISALNSAFIKQRVFDFKEILERIFTFTDSPFHDKKDSWKVVRDSCQDFNEKDVNAVKEKINQCKASETDNNKKKSYIEIEENKFFKKINSQEDYEAIYQYAKDIDAVYKADEGLASVIREFFGMHMNKIHATISSLHELNKIYIQPNLKNGTAWYNFDRAANQITSQSCAKLAEEYSIIREGIYDKSAKYMGLAAMLGLFALITYVISMLFAVFFKLSWGNRMSKDKSPTAYSYSSKSSVENNKKKKQEEKKSESDSSSFSEEAPRLSQRSMASQRGLASSRPSTQRGFGSQRGLATNRGFVGAPPSRGRASNRDYSSSTDSSYT